MRESRESKITLVLLGILAFVAVGFLLHMLEPILLPFVVAVFLAQLFRPLTHALRRRRVPAALSILLVLLVVSAVLAVVTMVVYTSATAFTGQLPAYQARLRELAQGLSGWIASESPRLAAELQKVKWEQAFELTSVTGFVAATVGSFLLFFNDAFLVLLFLVFLLAGSESFPAKLRQAMPHQAEQMGEMMRNIESGVRRYLLTKTLINLVTGTLVALLLAAFGVDFPLLWGLLTFLCHYIPNFGALISVAVPTVFFFLQLSPGKALLVALLSAAIQFAIGNALEPRVMGSSLNLSPLLVLLSLIFWGWLWGPWGMVLSIPITSTIKIICENVESLRPIAVLMSEDAPAPAASHPAATAQARAEA